MRKKQLLEESLFHYFGYKEFREGQKQAIEATVNGQDTLVMLPTGTGKSICYQLSGYLLDGLTVIVSPLLSLMEDQVGKMRQMGEKRVAALNSLLSHSEKQTILQSLADLKFLFLSPEMLYHPLVLKELMKQKIGLFAIDEAHCISQWGFDFRPEYLKLGHARKQLGNPITMALTATATKMVQQEIIDILSFEEESLTCIRASVDRPNIFLHSQISHGNKEEELVNLVRQLPTPGIIYFSSKKAAEKCAELINTQNIAETEVYHSTISSEDKIKIQAQFSNGNVQIVCATSAFGMGIDKSDIRFVIHFHVPGSPEQYLQEVGRCGRDGKPSVAILLTDPSDFRIQKYLIDSSYPTKDMLLSAYSNSRHVSLTENATETQKDLCKFYVQSGLSLEQAMEMIGERKKIKEKQLEWMRKFVQLKDSCLRNQLLAYFEEILNEKNTLCCSSCQTDGLSSFFLHPTLSNKKTNLEKPVENWTKMIQKLFRI